jgi:hypothetical protein
MFQPIERPQRDIEEMCDEKSSPEPLISTAENHREKYDEQDGGTATGHSR